MPQSNFTRSKKGNLTRKHEGGPPELTPRMKTMIELMVFGRQGEDRPLTIEEAGESVGYQRRASRALASAPVFVRAYDRACDELRKSEKARSLHTIIAIRDEEGAGKAADRKVRMDAAQALMDEGGGRGASVNVNIHNQVVTPGYVIDLSEPEPLTIDHEEP